MYVHCTAGMGRAPAVVCVYMVWKEGYELAQALAHVKDRKPRAAPNWCAMEEVGILFGVCVCMHVCMFTRMCVYVCMYVYVCAELLQTGVQCMYVCMHAIPAM